MALGARFDDRVTGKVSEFAPKAKIVHVDIDPAEIGKIREALVPIVGDVKDVLADLLVAYQDAVAERPADYSAWWTRLNGLKETYPRGWDEPSDGALSPQAIISRIGELTGPEGVYVAGVGQHQMWAAQFIRYERPGAFLNSGGAGTMGYSVPAAMGAKVAEPDRVVWSIDGDGCFQMTNQELATCTINDIPIKVAIINNSSLGMVRQWQTLFYDGRHSFTDLETGDGTRMIPDFVKLAEAYGALAIRVTKPEEVDPRDRARAGDERPTRGDRLRRESRRDGVADGPAGRRQLERPVRARPRTALERRVSHILSLLVEDQPGLLTRVAGLFARRGFNIESLAVGVSEIEGLSRITVVVDVEETPLEQVTKQLNKLVNVIKVVELEPAQAVLREHMLIKVKVEPGGAIGRSSRPSASSARASSTSRRTRSSSR